MGNLTNSLAESTKYYVVINSFCFCIGYYAVKYALLMKLPTTFEYDDLVVNIILFKNYSFTWINYIIVLCV